MRDSTCLLFSFLACLSCAEKRSLPTSAPAPTSLAAPDPLPKSEPATTQTAQPFPESFWRSPEAAGRFDAQGTPLPGALSAWLVADLNGDKLDEVVLAPGERECGTGGCAPARVFRLQHGSWVPLGELSVPNSVTPRWTSIALEDSSHEGFLDLRLERPGAPIQRALMQNGAYHLAATGGTLSPEKESSLMAMQGRYDPVRGFIPLGLWDKHGANEGAAVRVVVTAPDKKQFAHDLGTIAYPDEWHQALFPKDFAGAPAQLPPGVYLIEYFLGGVLAATSRVEVKRS